MLYLGGGDLCQPRVFWLQESEKPKLVLSSSGQGCPRAHAVSLGPSPLCPFSSLVLPASSYIPTSTFPAADGSSLLLGMLTPDSPPSVVLTTPPRAYGKFSWKDLIGFVWVTCSLFEPISMDMIITLYHSWPAGGAWSAMIEGLGLQLFPVDRAARVMVPTCGGK